MDRRLTLDSMRETYRKHVILFSFTSIVFVYFIIFKVKLVMTIS
jgi:hypothetical protein